MSKSGLIHPPSHRTRRPGRPARARRAHFTNILASLLLLLLPCIWTSCTTPIGVSRVAPHRAYRQVSESALSNNKLSHETRSVLHRIAANPERQFRKAPAEFFNALHQRALTDPRREILLALSELHYLRASQLLRRPGVTRAQASEAQDHYLAAALYAYFFIFDESKEPPIHLLDRRVNLARDLYNSALARALLRDPPTHSEVALKTQARNPIPGLVQINFDPSPSHIDLQKIDRFLASDEFKVHGLSVRERGSGLGSPLVAVGHLADQKRFPQRLSTTLFLRVNGTFDEWQGNRPLSTQLELYATHQTSEIKVGERRVALESDSSAALAYSLDDSAIWRLGGAQFFSAEERIASGIYTSEPYLPGRIPVVFVHGTFSSPVWWAEMINTLKADPILRQRYQFWNFIYNSGNPVSISAQKLRDSIAEKIHQVDPSGADPALRHLVLVGHSQGGLLSKLAVTDTGDALWRSVSNRDFDSLPLTPIDREKLRAQYFYRPLPEVSRVVFIATPHRGSYLANSFVRNVALRVVSLPENFIRFSLQFLTLENPLGLKAGLQRRIPTSLDDMSPTNPWLIALADLPVAPQVHTHSIVALKPNATQEKGSDGVVRYTSAHLDSTDSELVVESNHSCQDHPATIEEVRRILFEHLQSMFEVADPATP